MALKKILKYGVVCLCIYLPIAIFINAACETLEFLQAPNEALGQAILYGHLKERGLIPKTIQEMPKWVKDYKCVSYYDPNAWNDPNRIIFMQKKGCFYGITFGDGRQAIVTYYGRMLSPYPENIGLRELKLQPHISENWKRTIFLGIIATAIPLLVVKRKIKSIQVQNPPASTE